MTEAEAIQLAQQGDAGAFERIYRLHSRRVYALCLRMVGNTAEAEDLTQDAFLQLFRKIGTFRGESAFSTWLHRLAVNVVLMKLRKKTLPATSLEESTDPEDESSGPRREIGAPDLLLPVPSTEFIWSGPLNSCRRVTGRYSCSMTCRDLSTTKSPG